MEVSALKFSGGIGLHGRSPLLRVQSDERLVALIRRGNTAAFEVLFARYESRLLAFCRHMVSTREDAEDVLQEVMSAAYNALQADDRPVNVRPWLYRIARNRSLNHLRKQTAVGVDSMDTHFSDFGDSTADKASKREDFRLLVGDIQDLPETQRTALVLREMDALAYEQIAEAMETTVPSVKSLLVRARVGLAEAAEARMLTCDEVRDELGEIAEGLKRKMSPPVRRHLKTCKRCDAFRLQLKETNKALAALLPLGPLVVIKKLLLSQLGHHAGSGAAASSSAGIAGGAAAGGSALTSGGLISAGIGAIATKAAAGLAAAALLTAGAVAVDHGTRHHHAHHTVPSAAVSYSSTHAAGSGLASMAPSTPAPSQGRTWPSVVQHSSATTSEEAATSRLAALRAKRRREAAEKRAAEKRAAEKHAVKTTPVVTSTTPVATTTTTPVATTPTTPAPGRIQTQTVPTVLPNTPSTTGTTTIGTTTVGTTTTGASTAPTTSTAPAPPPPASTTPSTTTTTPSPSPTTTSAP